MDLDALKWSAGGYQKSELEHIYTFSGAVANRRADHVVTALLKYVTDIDEVKGLGFCVTVDHAEFMCRYFNDHNIPSMCLTVLDFIGQANRKYNFEDKFAALLSNATRSVSREIKDGFVSVPKGCYIQLEKKAAKYILENIRASYGNTAGLVTRAASFAEDSGLELTL